MALLIDQCHLRHHKGARRQRPAIHQVRFASRAWWSSSATTGCQQNKATERARMSHLLHSPTAKRSVCHNDLSADTSHACRHSSGDRSAAGGAAERSDGRRCCSVPPTARPSSIQAQRNGDSVIASHPRRSCWCRAAERHRRRVASSCGTHCPVAADAVCRQTTTAGVITAHR